MSTMDTTVVESFGENELQDNKELHQGERRGVWYQALVGSWTCLNGRDGQAWTAIHDKDGGVYSRCSSAICLSPCRELGSGDALLLAKGRGQRVSSTRVLQHSYVCVESWHFCIAVDGSYTQIFFLFNLGHVV